MKMKVNLLTKVIIVGIITLILGWFVALGLDIDAIQANTGLPPFVIEMPNGITSTEIFTPTLPGRLNLVASAFAIQAPGPSVTLTIDHTLYTGDAAHLHLVYRAPSQTHWRPVYAIHAKQSIQQVRVPGTGEYAWVQLVPAAAPPPPDGAIVVDDVAPEFITHTNLALGDWHIATTDGDYYGGHTHWSGNTVTVTDNWATWQPSVALNGVYAVWVYVPNYYAGTRHAQYVVYHTGLSTTVEVNQDAVYPDAAWVELGTFTFTSNTDSYVMLADSTGEPDNTRWVAFDAVAFVSTQHIYLPLILKNHPISKKQWTGVHMGNRIGDNSDWTVEMLSPFDPTQSQDGIWPKLIVAQSSQVFNVKRDSDDCHITGISIKNLNLYNYLSRATREGEAWVVVRIEPSPGNFAESANPAWTPDPDNRPTGRTLLTGSGELPGGWSMCGNDWRFRPVDDIGNEILAIQRFVLWESVFAGQPAWSVFGFEPANEPNIEWYKSGVSATVPALDQTAAWFAMDAYFAAVYDYVDTNAEQLPVRVLTPPMSQHAFAETHNLLDVDNQCPVLPFSGYQVMSNVFDSTTPKNDGYSFHNYWAVGREVWHTCYSANPGHHVTMYVPTHMNQMLMYHLRKIVITEADLTSEGMAWNSDLLDKDAEPQRAATSIRDFFAYEDRADAIAVWLLNDNIAGNAEHHWHQAYSPTTGFREWFNLWWNGNE